jgi:hypothetical protein
MGGKRWDVAVLGAVVGSRRLGEAEAGPRQKSPPTSMGH